VNSTDCINVEKQDGRDRHQNDALFIRDKSPNQKRGCNINVSFSIIKHCATTVSTANINTHNNTTTTVVRPLYRSTCISQHIQDFVGAKFYYPYALAHGYQRIRIKERTLEFSSTVLSTLSPYHSKHYIKT